MTVAQSGQVTTPYTVSVAWLYGLNIVNSMTTAEGDQVCWMWMSDSADLLKTWQTSNAAFDSASTLTEVAANAMQFVATGATTNLYVAPTTAATGNMTYSIMGQHATLVQLVAALALSMLALFAF